MSLIQQVMCNICRETNHPEKSRDWLPMQIRIGRAVTGESEEYVPFKNYEHVCPSCQDRMKKAIDVMEQAIIAERAGA